MEPTTNEEWAALCRAQIETIERLATAKNTAEQRVAELSNLLVVSEVARAAIPAQTGTPAVTVDSIESKFSQFWSYMFAWGNATPGEDADKKADEIVKYINAHTAQAVAAAREEGNTQGWVECEADMQPEFDAKLAAKQAEIDRLMLEFCPAEMSAEQMATWESHQKAAPQQHAQADDELPPLTMAVYGTRDLLEQERERRATGNAQAALSDEQIVALAAESGVFCTMPQAVALGRAILTAKPAGESA